MPASPRYVVAAAAMFPLSFLVSDDWPPTRAPVLDLLTQDWQDVVRALPPHLTYRQARILVADASDVLCYRVTWTLSTDDAFHAEEAAQVLSDPYLRFARVTDGQAIPYVDTVDMDDPPGADTIVGRAARIMRTGRSPRRASASVIEENE